jgi:hypothetical protein
MALVGGGGAGYVAGSNPTGTGTTLNYIGDHAYAYSGNLTVGGAGTVTALKFATGNSYIVGKFSPQYNGNFSEDFSFTFIMNGETLFVLTLQDQDNQVFNEVSVIIPSFSDVTIEIAPVSHTTNRNVSVLYTGRVYA